MRGPLQPPQYQALYRACIKDAALAGAVLVQATLARALAAWPQQAATQPDVVERSMLLEAAAVLKEQAQALAASFPQALLAEFAQAIAGHRVASLSFDALPLLADDQLQENFDLVRAARELQQAVQPQLAELEGLLAAAQAVPGATQRHPLRPETYVRALHRAARQSPVSPVVRRRWLRYLPAAMAPELAAVYERLSARLRAEGVAPEPAPPPAPLQPQDRATQFTIRELRTLLASEPPSGVDIPLAPPDTDFSHTVPAALQVLQDMRKVDQLLLQLRQRQAAMPAAVEDSRAAFRDALRRQARQPAQALALEVVHVMVENLGGDARLLLPVQEAVRDLEPALLRLALADPRFFSDRTHPARQLLEQVTQRSLAWSASEAPGFAVFLDGLQQAVEALLETRATGSEPFEIALHALQEAWAEAQPRNRRRERAVRALLRAEQRNLLAERIAGQIRARSDAGGAPPEALAFLTGPWAQVMAQARLADEAGTEDPGGYEAVVTTVLWSAQPNLAGRVAAQHGLTMERIEAGLRSIEHAAPDTQRWQTVLRQLRTLALMSAGGASPHVAEPAPVPMPSETWLAPGEVHDSGFVPEQMRPSGWGNETGSLPLVDVQLGAWLDLPGEGAERWQLTWASPHGLLFMFTQASGATRSMTRRRLQQLLAEGTVRLVSSHPVVDRALDAVVRAAWGNSMKDS
jgi:hypothetical protein